jgi:alpha-galactosidase
MLRLFLMSTLMLKCAANPNAVGQLPIMGWSGYNALMQASGKMCDNRGNVLSYNESTVLETADFLVSSGLAARGYVYLNLDDCWSGPNRTSDGKLSPNATRFPHGMAWLASQLNDKGGLKLGLYAAASLLTCRGFPGSQGYEEVDAATFASWGASFAKLDTCGGILANGTESWIQQYSRWSAALNATGRQMVFSCSWPGAWAHCVETLGPNATCGASPIPVMAHICHQWRYDYDDQATWSDANYVPGDTGGGIGDILYKAAVDPIFTAMRAVTGRGAFQDPDFLVVGCPTDGPCFPNNPVPPGPGMSRVEQRLQFSMWCLLAAPLIVGSDLRIADAFALETLLNADAVSINQDPLVALPRVVTWTNATLSGVWARTMANGDEAVVLLNLGPDAVQMSVAMADLGFNAGGTVFNVWSKATTQAKVSFSALVPSHDALLLRITPK